MKSKYASLCFSTAIAGALAGCGGNVNMIDPSSDAGASDSGIADTTIADSVVDTPDVNNAADVTPDTAVDAAEDEGSLDSDVAEEDGPAELDSSTDDGAVDGSAEDAAGDSDVVDSPSDGCPPGQSWCGVCTDIVTNPEACGWCGHACPVGASCNGGICECPAGTDPCAGVCVDEATNLEHCGACGHVCAVGASCEAGQCLCPTGMDDCAGVCVEESVDEANCGSCANTCAVGATCDSGVCECPGAQSVCSGACVDTQTDHTNCSACGKSCAVGEQCSGGVCVCLPTWTLCNGTCVDLKADGQNCGACGHDCEGGACDNGWCGPVVLSTNAGQPIALAADDEYVYWAAPYPIAVQLWRQAVSGSPPEVVADWLVSWQAPIDRQWVDSSNLYVRWSGSDDGFARVPKGGGTVEFLPDVGDSFIAAWFDSGKFFWGKTIPNVSMDVSIIRGDLPDLSPTTLATGQPNVREIVARDGYVYWPAHVSNAGKVVRVPEDGGDIEVIADNLLYPGYIAVDEHYVYWVDKLGLRRHWVPPFYGSLETIPNGTTMRNYVLNGGFLYGFMSGSIWQLEESIMPPALHERASGQSEVVQIVANACCVFWISDTSNSVMKMVK